jgi:parvulin-like peptidyl-prolyl isomerase
MNQMKNPIGLLLLIPVCCCVKLSAQETDWRNDKTWKADQQKIYTLKDVKDYDLKHPEIKAMVYSETVSKDSVEIVKKLHHNVLYYGNDLHRVIDVSPVVEMRARCIVFDAKKMPVSEINNKRNEILRYYSQGKSFKELAIEYTMDPGATKGGDLGWFTEKQMMGDFGKTVGTHKKGDIFTVDMERNDWYFVVLKTEDTQTRYEVSIVQINQ